MITADELAILVGGDVELKGRVLPASNLTFFGEVTREGQSGRCVYKPISGERPLWDFPDGTLAAREVAAYVVSEALGWNVVPLTVMREGPAGVGMVQIWRDPDPEQAPIDIVRLGELLAEHEIRALRARCRTLLTSGRMPLPSGDWPAIPWPAF